MRGKSLGSDGGEGFFGGGGLAGHHVICGPT